MTDRAVTTRGTRRTLPMVRAHPERFPRLLAAERQLATPDVELDFVVDLDVLLAGLFGRRLRAG